MKKMFVLSIVMLAVSMLSVYGIAKKSDAIWETVDVQHVYGGCTQYANVAQCGGGTTTCGDVACGVAGGPAGPGSYICPPFGYDLIFYAHRRLDVRSRDFYYSSTKTVESGGKTGSSPTTVTCFRKVECAATTCVPGGTPGTYYCSEASSTDEDVTDYTLSGSAC